MLRRYSLIPVVIVVVLISSALLIAIDIQAQSSFVNGLTNTGQNVEGAELVEPGELPVRIGRVIGYLLGFIGIIFTC